MTPAESKEGPFLRPKKWFPSDDWKKVKKQKVFGMTASNGKALYFLVPLKYTSELWAIDVEKKVAPFLKRAFPEKTSFQILLDGESLLHAPVAKRAMAKHGIKNMPGWPGYSPELNPQENVWGWAEPHLRDMESGKDTFETFQKLVLKAVREYPAHKKLVGGMTKRCKDTLDREGGALDY